MSTVVSHETARETSPICQSCGNTNPHELTTRMVYCGGRGYVPRVECIDHVECAARWDVLHKFISVDPAVRAARQRLERSVAA